MPEHSTRLTARDYKVTARMTALAYHAKVLPAGLTGDALANQILSRPEIFRIFRNNENEVRAFTADYSIVESKSSPIANGADLIVFQRNGFKQLSFAIAGVSNGFEELKQTVGATGKFGFNHFNYEGVKEVYQSIISRYSDDYSFDLYGHSLGGQMVQVLAAQFILDGRQSRLNSLVTYGSYEINFGIVSPDTPVGNRVLLDTLREYERATGGGAFVHFRTNGDIVSPAVGLDAILHPFTLRLVGPIQPSLVSSLITPGLPIHGMIAYVDALDLVINNTFDILTTGDRTGDLIAIASQLDIRTVPLEVIAEGQRTREGGISYTLSSSNYNLPQVDPRTGAVLPDRLRHVASGLGSSIFGRVPDTIVVDQRQRTVELDVLEIDGVPTVVASRANDGWFTGGDETWSRAGVTVETAYSNGQAISANILINDKRGNAIPVGFSDAGALLGQQLGYYLVKGDALTGVVASALLSTVGDNLGDALDGLIGNQSTTNAVEDAFSTTSAELLSNLRSAGIGAFSTFLTAELVNALGVDGLFGETINTAAGSVVNTVATNIVSGRAIFSGIDPAAIGTAIGSLLGNKLAREVITFDTIGGQLGSAFGSSLGVLAATLMLGGPAGVIGSIGILGVAAIAFIGNILGGLVGSLFGGTPRSGADVEWDPVAGIFTVSNGYSRKGGSLTAAESMAEAVAGTFNSILAMTGGALASPELVQVGNYGMRKSEYVYRPRSTRNKSAITKRFEGEKGAEQLIGYGVYQGLTDPDFKIVGGDVYAKRAFYNSFATGGLSVNDFDSSVLLGNIATAQRYQTYLANSTSINALIAAEPDSVFTAEWAIVFARSVELGLSRRHASDWYGGFGLLMEEAGVTATEIEFSFNYDHFADKVSRFTALGPYVLGDMIDVAGQDTVEGTTGADTIDLSAGQLAAGLIVNDATLASAKAIKVAATVDGGEGDDTIRASDRGDNLIGNIGNDTLIGGRLDDWLIGGEGDDRLFAGRVANGGVSTQVAIAADGGSGNYLDGGDGNDLLYGSTGSDWLAGGAGVDVLVAGGGGDVLNAGSGNDVTVEGGGGSDQYVFNRGDGQDVYFDDASGGVPGATVDRISKAVSDRNAGILAKNWAGGGEFTVDGSTLGGEDAISFGAGINMGDILLERSGTVTNPGMDLIIKIQVDGVWQSTDDQITVRDWFEGTRRIEWLRFANGEELRIGDFVTIQKGSAGNDVLIGTNGNDFQYGGDGDDTLFGLGGDDFQIGGKGNDLVSGNNDNDIVFGGDDDDVVLGGLGNDFVSGDRGNDLVYGGAGNDIVVGARGDDELAGGAGNDIIRYERGDGRDTVLDEFAGTWDLVWTGDSQTGGYTNGYVVDQNGVVRKDTEIVHDGTKWLGQYDYSESGTSKTLRRLIAPAPGAPRNRNAGTDTLEFGVGIDIQDLAFRQEGNNLRIAIARGGGAAGAFDDVVDQLTIVDWFAGGTAGKSIERFQFVNTGVTNAAAMNLVGGSDGADTLTATAGTAAWMTGGAGDDVLTGTSLADILNGASGADTLNGGGASDVLYGGDGDDVLVGGAAADILIGGSGSDTASYAGSAAVTVFLDAGQGTSTGGDAVGDTFDSIENLTGSNSNDTLYGDAGDNVLDGGQGTDTLYGGAGDDIYLFNTNSGTDTVIDRVMNGTAVIAGDAGDDTVEVGETLSLSNLAFVKVGNDLQIQVAAAIVNRLNLKDFYANSEAKIENLVFVDGLLARLANLRIGTQLASEEADLIAGTTGIDTLRGLGGNDVLSGSAGNDTLIGDEGDDVLEGGAGADVLDGGGDSVTAGGVPGPSANGDTIRYAGSSAGVSVNIATRALSGGEAAGDTIALHNGVSSIENVTGSRFGDTLTGDARANTLIGLAGNDTLIGGAGDDVLLGGDGADIIAGGEGEDSIDAGGGDDTDVRGGAGNDLVVGGAGNDALWGDEGDDTLDGGSGDDLVRGGEGADTLGGGDGADTLWGEAGDDRLAGGAGNDALNGGSGADTLSGDAGNDTLDGGLGDDIYVFDAVSGQDTIIDTDGANRIVFAGVTEDQLWLTRVGNNLQITVIGGTSQVTVTNIFGGTPRGQLREIATANASLFLKYAGGDTYAGSLIEAMTAAGPVAPPSQALVPQSVAEARAALWHAGGRAVPTLADQALSTNEDTVLSGMLAVIDHDENVVGFEVHAQGAHGTVAIDTSGAWSYTPSANYFGEDSFEILVRDGDGQSATARVTVAIASVNDAPVWGATPALTISENAANGSLVQTLDASDADGDTVVYSITDSNSAFQITAAGVLSVRAGHLLDYEAGASVQVTVRASDGQVFADKMFTIALQNVNEAPNAPSVISQGIAIAAEPGASLANQTIATFTLTDPDLTTPSLRLRAGAASMFAISGNSLRFAAGFAPNFEALAAQPGAVFVDRDGDGLKEIEFSAEVEAWDGQLASATATRIVVGIEDTNEAPTDIQFTSPTITERDRPLLGTPLTALSTGFLTGIDPDLASAGESHLYSTTDNRFEVVNGRELRLKAGAALDYETALVESGTGRRYIEVPVTVRDRAGGAGSKSLTQAKRIYIADAIDYHYGTSTADTLTGGANIDHLFGGAGNDILAGGSGNDLLYGEIGNDTLRGNDGNDALYGGQGDDLLYGEAGDDALWGDDGADTLEGGVGADILRGGTGNDALYGGEGADSLHGEDGNDYLDGGADNANDTLYGDAGDDTLLGGGGNDRLDGGAGNDQLAGGAGADILIGGDGIDTANYSASTSYVSVHLYNGTANGGDAQGDTLTEIENLVGSSGADTLIGSADANWIEGGEGDDWIQGEEGDDALLGQGGNDTLHGGIGADQLQGGTGNDALYGWAGNDVLTGGAGDDLLIGGAGDDRYVFARGEGNDTVDQTGSLASDNDIVGFTDLGRDNLWFSSVGNSIKIGVLGVGGLDSSVLLKDFRTASSTQTAQIRVVIAQTDATIDLKLGELTTQLDRFANALGGPITTQAQFNSLQANTSLKIDGLTFQQTWTNYWTSNRPATVTTAVSGLNATEDQYATSAYNLSFTVADDYDAPSQLAERTVMAVASHGSTTLDASLLDLAVTWPVSNGGTGTINVRTKPNASGTGWVWIHTKDTGGLVSDAWVPVSVAPVADAPNITASSPGGNAGQGIPLTIAAQLTDTDGSESIARIEIRGVPAGFTLVNAAGSISAGNNVVEPGTWYIAQSDLAGLKLVPPAGWSQDLSGPTALRVRAVSVEQANQQIATGAEVLVPVRINAAPAAPTLSNTAINENVSAGTIVGMLQANDPDRLENNLVDLNTSTILPGESRWIANSVGPEGSSVTVLQSGQQDAESAGGMISNEFSIDPTKAYKFTVFVRADSPDNTNVYFGVSANWDPNGLAFVENAENGADDRNPYFMAPVQNSLTPGKWYRFEGYVLPRGSAPVERGVFGGVFDVATGQKVSEANTFRWNDALPSGTVHTRFFNYYGTPNGWSTSWYQPVVEQLPTFTQTGGAGLSVDSATGLVRVTASPNFEAAASLPLSVTVTDAGGLQSSANLLIQVNNVNEAPSLSPAYSTAFFRETGTGSANGLAPADAGAVVATFVAIDPDGTAPALEFVSNPNNWFSIDQATRTVRFNPGLDFNYEWARGAGYQTYDWNGNGILEAYVADVYVRATDGSLLSNEGLVQVFIEDAPEAPVNLRADRTLSLAENSQGSYTLGVGGFAWILADDPDGEPLSYTLVDGMNGYGGFGLRSDGLLYTTGASFNFEQVSQYTIRVRATDPSGLSTTRDLQVDIANVNERPNNLVLEAQNVFAESLPGQSGQGGNLIARFGMSDPDGQTPGLVILDGNPQGWFAIAGGHVAFSPWPNFSAEWLRNNVGNYGITSGHDSNGNGILEYRVGSLTIAAQDGGGLRSDPMTYHVYIEDVNEAPFIQPTGNLTILENSTVPGVTPVGAALSTTDQDISPAFARINYSLVGGDVSAFSINSSTGQIVAQQSFNYEARQNYSLTVRATDGGGLFHDRLVPIFVTDQNDRHVVTRTSNTYATGRQTSYFRVIDEDDSNFTATATIVSSQGYSGVPDAVSVAWNSASGQFEARVTGYEEASLSHSGIASITVRDNRAVGGFAVTQQFSYVINGRPLGPGEHIPPVVLDLDGDGIELVGLDASTARFDMDGDGKRDQTGWIGKDDGFLVYDRDGDGMITSVNEFSFALDLEGAVSDLEGLRAFDSNGNGAFDQGDFEFTRFGVWQDVNQDGISQKGEVKTLAEWNIASIWLGLTETGEVVEGATDNVLYATSEFFRPSGQSGDVGDVFLAYRSAADLDANGKMKKDKKVKFAGVADPDALPDKLKKKDKKDKQGGTLTSSGNANLGPIVIDLDGDGVELTAFAGSTVFFDMDNDGLRERTGWAGADDGLLAFDWNGNGIIDDAVEISFQALLPGAFSDLDGLAAFDENGDRLIDARDGAFARLSVWQDANQNGVTDEGELRSLTDRGIVSISLASVLTGNAPSNEENVVYARTTAMLSDGSAAGVDDVFFTFEKAPEPGEDEGSDTSAPGGENANETAEPLTVSSRSMEGKMKHHRLHAEGGYPVVRPTKTKGMLSPEAGLLGGVTLMRFKDQSVGALSAIVLDLDGDGVETKRLGKTRAAFDMDGNGRADDTGWVSGGDGFLVTDLDEDGHITGPGELSLLGLAPEAQSSRDALATLDANSDLVIDKEDDRFNVLKVWVDRNANGRTDAGELKDLAEHGITAIYLAARASGESSKLDTNLVAAMGTFARADGSLGTAGDMLITFKPSTASRASPTINPGSDGFDDWRGDYGRDHLQPDGPIDAQNFDLPAELRSSPRGYADQAGTLVGSSPSLENNPLDAVSRFVAPFAPSEGAEAERAQQQQDTNSLANGNQFSSSAGLALEDGGTGTQREPEPVGSGIENMDYARSDGRRLGDENANGKSEKAKEGQEFAPLTPSVRQNVPEAELTHSAESAARLLRQPASLSLNIADRLTQGRGQSGSGLATNPASIGSGPANLDKLIAAMAAFQGAEGMGAMGLQGPAPLESATAQLAPSV